MGRPKNPCGTEAAYRRHLKEKTPTCDPCRAAHREFGRGRSNSAGARAKRAAAKAAESIPALPTIGEAPTTEEGHVFRLGVLKQTLQDSRETIAVLKRTDPARVYLLMREQREILREISEIQGNGQVKGVTLADQLADARAARAARASGA